MEPSRRRLLAGCSAVATSAAAGCLGPVWGSTTHFPMTVRNETDRTHTARLTLKVDDSSYSHYFDRTITLEPGEERRYPEAFSTGDSSYSVAIRVRLDEGAFQRGSVLVSVPTLDEVVVTVEPGPEVDIRVLGGELSTPVGSGRETETGPTVPGSAVRGRQ